MLYPLFDKDCDLVGWINPGEHIFDTDMDYLQKLCNYTGIDKRGQSYLAQVEYTARCQVPAVYKRA